MADHAISGTKKFLLPHTKNRSAITLQSLVMVFAKLFGGT
jgi:hypothetical protein